VPRKHLLVVDDEDTIREIAALTLGATSGWQVTSASSGPEALKLATTLHPDAILLDVMMPDIDGPSTFRMLRGNAATKDIPVIFLTAKVQSSDTEKFLQMGVQGIIAKPFDPLSLAHQVSELLHWDEAT
jgi:two-component system, OmpR family, alkaline phosphatase synthesis response regulator PhoP